MKKGFSFFAGLVLLGAIGAGEARAQWVTQSFSLQAGWNAVYLHVDASYDTVENLVGGDPANPILEIWKWQPSPTTQQFVQSPQEPTHGSGLSGDSQWLSWVRNATQPGTLARLRGNAAYLVRVAAGTASYTWQVKGRPLCPAYQWTTTGLNFLGFPTVSTDPPDFETFLGGAPALLQNAEIYQYVGGDLGPQNPRRVYALRTTPVTRGEACWIRAGHLYNRYYAPFELRQANAEGVHFGEERSSAAFRLRNLTAAPLTITLRLRPSEAPPSGQPALAGVPSLIVRGALNPTDLTYGYQRLTVSASRAWTLAAAGEEGSEVEVALGLDRADMGGNVGDLFAGVLEFTDSLGQARMDLAVSARPASSAGLWLGSALVNQVGQYLKQYARGSDGRPLMNGDGSYVVNGVDTHLDAVATPFPLRLIVHNPATGHAVLLQRVYLGAGRFGRPVVGTVESVLDPDALADARRISAVHLPWSADNSGWVFDGRLGAGGAVTATVTLDYADQASNPFLHTYHPDHDNLDATFRQELPRGAESYTVERLITLTPQPPADDFNSLIASGRELVGDYAETLRVVGLQRANGPDIQTFEARGSFILRRISPLDTLTTP